MRIPDRPPMKSIESPGRRGGAGGKSLTAALSQRNDASSTSGADKGAAGRPSRSLLG